jgi:hypothetical protein
LITRDVFQGASGRFGEQRGDREPEYGGGACNSEKASQADVILKDRDQEDPDEGTELADARCDAVSRRPHADWEDL